MKYDVCIIGGGAAGLAAAASFNKESKNSGPKICVLDKNEKLGRKLMATGGGRCNITNAACYEKEKTLDFFRNLGVETYSDAEGRYYPYTNRASDVVMALTKGLGKNVDVKCGFCVKSVSKSETLDGGRFLIAEEGSSNSKAGRNIFADRVILASGGKAAPQFGTTGDGYGIARAFGHRITKTYPILTGIECSRPGVDFSTLKGIRAFGEVSLLKDGETVASEKGEIQFTEWGISGICVFDLTPYINAEENEDMHDAVKRFTLEVDLAPDFDLEVMNRRESTFGILTHKLANIINTRDIKTWSLRVTGVRGWRDAQATAGGVPLDEIDMKTMESRVVPGLYFAGEIIDVQGPCGGFNLQNAWETGIKAAKSIEELF